MSEPTARAVFIPQTGSQQGEEIPVHFNPATLEYSITNTLKDEGSGNKKKQHVSQSSAKLTMDLIFDTTHNGEDVRLHTSKIARFMQPDEGNAPAVVLFEWSAYSFQGMVESYKETIELFSSDGVPLRSTIKLGMAQQDTVFELGSDQRAASAPDAVDFSSGGQSMTDVASQAGDPAASRGLGAQNGVENLRFPGAGSLTVSASVSLKGPSAFASGGAGISAGAGFGVSGGAGFGVSGGAGFGVGGGAGFGVSSGAGFGVSGGAGVRVSGAAGFSLGPAGSARFSASSGSRSSARVSASAGAFRGLRVTSATPSVTLNPARLIPRNSSAQLATDAGASFQVGGKASVQGSAGLRTDVGGGADVKARLKFGDA